MRIEHLQLGDTVTWSKARGSFFRVIGFEGSADADNQTVTLRKLYSQDRTLQYDAEACDIELLPEADVVLRGPSAADRTWDSLPHGKDMT